MKIQLEVCANSIQSAIAAQKGGASRIELCDNLSEGGTTPSYGLIKVARRELDIPIHVLLRPRAGDFLYTEYEFDTMMADVEVCSLLKCDAVVIGILNADGSVDKTRCTQLVELAKKAGLKTTFHRAFDMSNDLFQALEDVIEMGFDCILTSGGKTTAIEGASKIVQLMQQAAGRIEIMPGSGLNENNVADLVHFTGANIVHSSARVRKPSAMQYFNTAIMLNNLSPEDSVEETDAVRVKSIITRANEPY